MGIVGVQLGRVFERSRALERERASAAFRAHMLSVLSHDLRSPAAAIRSFATLLESEWDDLDRSEGLDMVGRVRRQADRIVDLVGELLTVQRLDAGAMATDEQVVDVAMAVEQVVDDLGLHADVTVTTWGRIRATVDPGHLDRMLTNLLANASRHGRPPIEVSLETTQGRVAIGVRDHGEGLPASMQDRVFEPFAAPVRA